MIDDHGRTGGAAREPGDADDDFVERIARPLRAREKLVETFEVRVMSAVHAEARARTTPGPRRRPAAFDWWLRPRVVRLSPLHGLAAAAACIALALPAAAQVRIGPWEAALGMAASSFVVVLNALRPLTGNKAWKAASPSSSPSRSPSYS